MERIGRNWEKGEGRYYLCRALLHWPNAEALLPPEPPSAVTTYTEPT